MRWHCPPDTGFEIRALAVWGRACYFSVTEVPHNNESLRMSREETFCFFETWRPEWGSNPRFPIFQAGNFYRVTRLESCGYRIMPKDSFTFNYTRTYDQRIEKWAGLTNALLSLAGHSSKFVTDFSKKTSTPSTPSPLDPRPSTHDPRPSTSILLLFFFSLFLKFGKQYQVNVCSPSATLA